MKTKSPAIFAALAIVAATAVYFSLPQRGSSPNAASDAIPVHPVAAGNRNSVPSQTFFADPRKAPSWTVPFGKEFWKPERRAPMTTKAQILASGLIERMQLCFQQDGSTGRPLVLAKNYTIAMDEAGFRYTAGRGADAASFHVATRAVTIPGLSTQNEIGDWKMMGNTAQRDRFGNQSVIEHVEAEPQGASVTWVLQQQPASPRDSSIEVAVSGGATVSPTGRIQIGKQPIASWGKAVAVDATGKRTPLETHFQNETITVRLPGDLLAGSAYPLAIDPTISPLVALDPDETLEPTTVIPEKVIATDTGWLLRTRGGNLVLIDATGEAILPQLYDSRSFEVHDIAYVSSGKYLAVGTVDSDDTKLEALLFEVAGGAITNESTFTVFQVPADEHPHQIRVDSSVDGFLVTWTIRSDETGDLTEGVLGVILNADGTPAGVPFGIAPFDPDLEEQFVYTSAGSTGTRSWLAVVLADEGPTYSFTANYITNAGVGVQTPIAGEYGRVDLAWADGWLAAWRTDTETMGQRFATNGTANGAAFQISAEVDSLGLVGGTTGWAQMFKDIDYDLSVTTIAANGTTASVDIGVNGNYKEGDWSSNLAGTASLFLLTQYGNGFSIDRSLIIHPATGALLTGPTDVIEKPNDQTDLAVAGNGTTLLAAWIDDAQGDRAEVRGVRLDHTGAVLDATPLDFSASAAGSYAGDVAVASLGNDFLVAFIVDNTTEHLVLGRLCGGDGVLSGAAPFEIDAGEFGLNTGHVAVQSNGTKYFVAWIGLTEDDYDEVQGVEVEANGTVGTRVAVAEGSDLSFFSEVTLATDGSDWMVGYTGDFFTPDPVSKFVARRVASPGTLVGTEIVILPDYAEDVAMAFSGTQYLAVWNDFSTDLLGRRFTSAGTLFSQFVVDDFAQDASVIGQANGWLVGLSGYDDGIFAPRVVRVNANGVPDRVPSTVDLVEGYAYVANNGLDSGGFAGVQRFDMLGSRVFGATVEYEEPLVTNAASAAGRVGVAFSFALTSTSATSYNVAGTLPPGLSLSPTTGLISGKPSVAGTYPLTILASKGADTGEMSFSIRILPALPDRTPPTIRAKSVVITRKKTAAIRVSTNDGVRIRYRVKPPKGKYGAFRTKTISRSVSLKIRTPREGTYVVDIRAYDRAGNASPTKRVRVKRRE